MSARVDSSAGSAASGGSVDESPKAAATVKEVRQCGDCKLTDVKVKLRCSRCQEVWYCGPEHQKAHWPTHKKVCKPASTASSSQATTGAGASTSVTSAGSAGSSRDDQKASVVAAAAIQAESKAAYASTATPQKTTFKTKEEVLHFLRTFSWKSSEAIAAGKQAQIEMEQHMLTLVPHSAATQLGMEALGAGTQQKTAEESELFKKMYGDLGRKMKSPAVKAVMEGYQEKALIAAILPLRMYIQLDEIHHSFERLKITEQEVVKATEGGQMVSKASLFISTPLPISSEAHIGPLFAAHVANTEDRLLSIKAKQRLRAALAEGHIMMRGLLKVPQQSDEIAEFEAMLKAARSADTSQKQAIAAHNKTFRKFCQAYNDSLERQRPGYEKLILEWARFIERGVNQKELESLCRSLPIGPIAPAMDITVVLYTARNAMNALTLQMNGQKNMLKGIEKQKIPFKDEGSAEESTVPLCLVVALILHDRAVV